MIQNINWKLVCACDGYKSLRKAYERDVQDANKSRQHGFIEDTTTILACGTEISAATNVPKESYSKEDLIKVFGEKRAMRILNQLARNLP